jgi:hypothetical protein
VAELHVKESKHDGAHYHPVSDAIDLVKVYRDYEIV